MNWKWAANNLHDGDSSICNCRPVDGADKDATSDEWTQLWDDSVCHIHDVDQWTYNQAACKYGDWTQHQWHFTELKLKLELKLLAAVN